MKAILAIYFIVLRFMGEQLDSVRIACNILDCLCFTGE
jgi:hypothetical protein